jgi:hypothetical protein
MYPLLNKTAHEYVKKHYTYELGFKPSEFLCAQNLRLKTQTLSGYMTQKDDKRLIKVQNDYLPISNKLINQTKKVE